MSVTYQVCEDRTVLHALHNTVLNCHHDLKEAKATFLVLWAISEPDEGGEFPPAIKSRGVPALAQIGIVSLKDRAAGLADVRLLIDKHRWDELTDGQRRALLDHECSRLVVKRICNIVARDDLNRPKINTRPADFNIDGFAAVIRRHAEDSLEIVNLIDIHTRFVQPHFDWEAKQGVPSLVPEEPAT